MPNEVYLVRKKGASPKLGYKLIMLMFNAGPLPDGNHCLFVKADGQCKTISSAALIHDLPNYRISTMGEGISGMLGELNDG